MSSTYYFNLKFPSFALANHKAQGDLQIAISCMVFCVSEIDAHEKEVLSCEKPKILQIEVLIKIQENFD